MRNPTLIVYRLSIFSFSRVIVVVSCPLSFHDVLDWVCRPIRCGVPDSLDRQHIAQWNKMRPYKHLQCLRCDSHPHQECWPNYDKCLLKYNQVLPVGGVCRWRCTGQNVVGICSARCWSSPGWGDSPSYWTSWLSASGLLLLHRPESLARPFSETQTTCTKTET